jgi:hypothetical protein
LSDPHPHLLMEKLRSAHTKLCWGQYTDSKLSSSACLSASDWIEGNHCSSPQLWSEPRPKKLSPLDHLMVPACTSVPMAVLPTPPPHTHRPCPRTPGEWNQSSELPPDRRESC